MRDQKMLDSFKGVTSSPPPLWLMRQAGRYLPEYRQIRKKFPSFIDLCLHPEAVCEITLQPIQRFGLDGAILFSDILLLPALLGQSVIFKEGEGPLLETLDLHHSDLKLSSEKVLEGIQPILKALRLIRESLPPTTTLIGFAGAPWTVAAYMLEGKTSKDFAQAKEIAFRRPTLFKDLLSLLGESTCLFLDHQIQAGAQIIQLFESWAGSVPAPFFQEWVIDPTRKIVSFLKKKHPLVPIIGFPKGAGVGYFPYLLGTGLDGLSLDSTFPLESACSFPTVLQGNLDPALLVAGGDPLFEATRFILNTLKNKPFVFNLGHGILPNTPIHHVMQLVNEVRSFT